MDKLTEVQKELLKKIGIDYAAPGFERKITNEQLDEISEQDMKLGEFLKSNKEEYENVKKQREARKKITDFLEAHSGLFLNYMDSIVEIKYGKVIKKVPLFEALDRMLLEGDSESLHTINEFISLHKEEKYEQSNALQVINELVKIDNQLNDGKNRELFRSYARECTNRDLTGQVNIVEPASDALNEYVSKEGKPRLK